MNKDQKAAIVEDVAAQIEGSEAVLAVDYRGISVPQAAALRERLNEAGARFRVVKNTLTMLAVEKAGAQELKELLVGPTAFTFVAPDRGDVAMAAKALSQFHREHEILDFKGGRMKGEPLTIEQLQSLARLPARDVLDGQLVGVLASPVTGLVRGLNQLVAGLAFQLGQIAEQGLVGGEAPAEEAGEAPAQEAAEEAPEGAAEAPAEEAAEAPAEEAAEAPAEEAAEETPQEAEQEAEEGAAEGEAEESAGEGGDAAEPSGDAEETAEGGDASAEEQTEDTEAPSEGEEQKEG